MAQLQIGLRRVIKIILRTLRIKIECVIRVIFRVLEERFVLSKKPLRFFLESFRQIFVVEKRGRCSGVNQQIVKNSMSRACQYVNRDFIPVVKPKHDGSVNLPFGSVQLCNRNSSRLCSRHAYAVSLTLTMPRMARVLLASVLPCRFPFQYLRARDRHYFRCKLFETLEWRFGFGRLGGFHEANNRIL